VLWGHSSLKLPPNKNSLNLKTRTKLKKLKFNPVLVQITQSTWVTRQDHGFNHGSSVGAAGSPKALCVKIQAREKDTACYFLGH
jgi:hypothetical protein